MGTSRTIIHLDMDAFFAAIEQRDRPELRGRPVIIGADPKDGRGRGVVSTASRTARRFGIRRAQPISEAWRRWPHGVYLRPEMGKYSQVSDRVFDILGTFTPAVEPVSVDEAFLDVTGVLHNYADSLACARAIQSGIESQTGLTASLGIAPCKMVAKIASDLEKPRGCVLVRPDEVESFLSPLPVGKLWGVGPKTRETLRRLGVETIGDLAACDPTLLEQRLGKQGPHLYNLAHGRDDRPVEPGGEAKSVGNEHTFAEDTSDASWIAATLMRLCERVSDRLTSKGISGRTVTTKIRFSDFTTHTRAHTLPHPVSAAPDLFEVAERNISDMPIRSRPVRLIGVAVSGLASTPPLKQRDLFSAEEERREMKQRALQEAIHRIRSISGSDAIRHGLSLYRPKPPKEE